MVLSTKLMYCYVSIGFGDGGKITSLLNDKLKRKHYQQNEGPAKGIAWYLLASAGFGVSYMRQSSLTVQ